MSNVTCRPATCTDGPQLPGIWIIERGRVWIGTVDSEVHARLIVAALKTSKP